MESCSRTKDGEGWLALGEDELQRIWKEYFDDLYNIETQELVAVYMGDFSGVQRGNYFRGEPIRRTKVEARVRRLKNIKVPGKDKVTLEMMQGGCEMVLDWIWKLCNMGFESGGVSEDWRSAVIVSLYKGKGERTECKNYRGITLLSLIGKIYAILMETVHRETEGVIDDEQRGFRSG